MGIEKHPLGKGGYSVDDYDRLNRLGDGYDTDGLIEVLGRNVVLCGLRVYRIMRDIADQILPFTEDQIQNAAQELWGHRGRC